MLEASNINLFYGASHALRNVSIAAETGKITCVLGRNGVGKSSLLRAITGRQAQRGGRIVLDGRDITSLSAADRARLGIGYVPQGREIFSMLTVEENLRSGFACLPRGQRSLPDETFQLFPVLRDMLKRRGGDLSGGQQQQLAIARALVVRPRLLVLDEPTEGIQPSIIKDIERVIVLLRSRGDMAIVLVEQYFDFAHRLADSLVVLDRGQVVVAGAASEVSAEAVRKYLTV